ncbi:unnamed protein product [Urochloa decumbens]|uniref:F-box domain-containing protein n=1 Tax=Urochloa decumbens TaxID=240449 RepID=A0ABC9B7P1_9POAL
MDSGAGTSADHTQHAPLPVCVRKRGKASREAAAAAAQTRCLTRCDPARPDEAQEIQHCPWGDLPADILGVVVGRLPHVEDRARLRSVCRAWRSAARLHSRPPLPLLVLFDFSFASFCAGGTLTGARRRVPLPERETASAGSVHCVGSCEGWLVGVRLNKGRYFGDLRCFLMKAYVLPGCHPSPASVRSRPPRQLLQQVSPYRQWLWCGELRNQRYSVCDVVLQGDNNGMIVSRVERIVFELPEATGNYNEMWRIVEWRGKLLIVASYSVDTEFGHVIVEVRVFESDFTTNPVRFTEIVSLDGDCIFISPSSSKSFCSCDYDGVGEDLIYFIDGNLCPEKFVYNMKDGMMAPLVADGPEDKFWTPDDGPKIATWLFPTE